jgi:hypothetical protein
LSDDVVQLDQEIHAFATTTDSFVDNVIFRWIRPNAADGEVVREIAVPIAIGQDSFSPDTKGDWIVEADFQNGQVLRKTLTVGFFVIPESPIGAIAMVIASMAVLGGFLYFRSRQPIVEK